MVDPISAAMNVAASGLEAQGMRMRVVAENMANADTTAAGPGGEPYRRKTIVFKPSFDDALGAARVEVRQIGVDGSEFVRAFDPGHPAADQDGYVMRPNVSAIIEAADMREAMRSYEANLNLIEQARAMAASAIDLLRR